MEGVSGRKYDRNEIVSDGECCGTRSAADGQERWWPGRRPRHVSLSVRPSTYPSVCLLTRPPSHSLSSADPLSFSHDTTVFVCVCVPYLCIQRTSLTSTYKSVLKNIYCSSTQLGSSRPLPYCRRKILWHFFPASSFASCLGFFFSSIRKHHLR